MKRRGLGKGLGKGYKNMIPKDPYIHGLSAKGVKQRDWMRTVIKFEDLNPDYPSSQMSGIASEINQTYQHEPYIDEKIENTKRFYNSALDNFGRRIKDREIQQEFKDRLKAGKLDAKGKSLTQLMKERIELIKELEIMEENLHEKGEWYKITEDQLLAVEKEIAKRTGKKPRRCIHDFSQDDYCTKCGMSWQEQMGEWVVGNAKYIGKTSEGDVYTDPKHINYVIEWDNKEVVVSGETYQKALDNFDFKWNNPTELPIERLATKKDLKKLKKVDLNWLVHDVDAKGKKRPARGWQTAIPKRRKLREQEKEGQVVGYNPEEDEFFYYKELDAKKKKKTPYGLKEPLFFKDYTEEDLESTNR